MPAPSFLSQTSSELSSCERSTLDPDYNPEDSDQGSTMTETGRTKAELGSHILTDL